MFLLMLLMLFSIDLRRGVSALEQPRLREWEAGGELNPFINRTLSFQLVVS